MNDEEKRYLRNIVAELPKDCTIVEVGSYLGKSARQFGKGLKRFRRKGVIHCVDRWCDYDGEDGAEVRKRFDRLMKPFPHKAIQEDSATAHKHFEDKSVDLLYIDANHSYECVKEDITNWYPKLKKNGILIGHDYSEKFPGVEKATKEIFGDKVNVVARSIWRVYDSKRTA